LKAVKKQWIEDFVVAEAQTKLKDDKLIERIADAVIAEQNKENAVIPLLRQRLTDTEKQIDNMVGAIAQGIVTPSTKRKLNELEIEKSELEIQLLQEEISQKLLTREQILCFLHQFRNADITLREVRIWLIDCFVNAVYVYDNDKFFVSLNYTDGTEKVTKDEIEEVFGSTMAMSAPPQFF